MSPFPRRRTVCAALLTLLFLLPGLSGAALVTSDQGIWVTGDVTHPIGRHLQYLPETGRPLRMEEAHRRLADGLFLPLDTDVLSSGIGADPVWVHWTVNNPADQPQDRVIIAGATWIDRIDFYAVRNDEVVAHQTAGDASPNFRRPVAGLGSLFEHDFPPGRTDIYLRAENPDPLMFPVRFVTPEAARNLEDRTHYSYGAVYGFLFALLAYNFMLWLGLGRPSHRDYSIYLGCFIAMNMAYTGHGYEWFWPDSVGFQQYIILIFMVCFAAAGLNFARGFLDLPRYSPGLARGLQVGSLGALALMALLVIFQQQTLAALLSFSVALVFTIVMFLLGWLAVVRGYTAARYFVTAAFSGVVGIASTTVTVWGWVPYTQLGFRAVELGLLIEATLLALAVSYLVREHDRARRRAEQLARIDALTGLLNRRALTEQGEGLWSIAQRNDTQLSLVLLDLDHFKRINDAYGHAVGDRVLMEAAQLIRETCRKGDLSARWGGEEFLLLLPGAGRHEARALAERLRESFANHPLSGDGATVVLRASFGIATLDRHASLDALIKEADDYLYKAKQEGRDRICAAEGLPTRSRPAV